jgi:hypothetical protein
MDNGCSIDFVNANPEVDRLRILEGVASVRLRRYTHVYLGLLCSQGMEYLHSQRFVHGDLRGVSAKVVS